MATTAEHQEYPVNREKLKARQQTAWSAGDYGVIGTTLQIVGEELCEALDIRSGHKVLDVAAGNGNASLAAARRWCDVIATDWVPALLSRARERAAAERLVIEFYDADAEALPFPDCTFDMVISTFGVMYSLDHDRAAAEMVRVCKHGGKIGLANWTPGGFIGQVCRIVSGYAPSPAEAPAPTLWGTRARLCELFGARAASIRSAQRDFVFRYRSPDHWLQVFRRCDGPLVKAFSALDFADQEKLHRELLALIDRFNRSRDASMVVPSEYLEVVITRH